MNMLERFKDIMSANINALLDKCEDPEKMVDQYLLNLREDLAEVKRETSSVMAEEKRAKRKLDDNSEEIGKYMGLAQKALKAGNEEDAKVFIAKKQFFDAQGVDLKEMYGIAFDNAQKMRELHDKLVKDIQSLDEKKSIIKAKVSVAKTQGKINDITNSIDSSSASISAFERMEAKADKMLDEANSMDELNKVPKDEASELEGKYSGGGSASVDDELAKLKAEMGI